MMPVNRYFVNVEYGDRRVKTLIIDAKDRANVLRQLSLLMVEIGARYFETITIKRELPNIDLLKVKERKKIKKTHQNCIERGLQVQEMAAHQHERK